MRDHLDRLPLVLAARAGRLWNVYKPGEDLSYGELWARQRTLATIGLATYALFVAAGLFGAVLLRRRGVTLLPLLATLVAATLTSMIAFGFSRYRLVAEPAIVVLAAVGLEAAAVSRARHPRRAGPAAGRAGAAAPPAHLDQAVAHEVRHARPPGAAALPRARAGARGPRGGTAASERERPT